VRFAVEVAVENPNTIEVIVDCFEYRLLLNGTRADHGTNRTKLTIQPGETGVLPLENSVPTRRSSPSRHDVQGNDFKGLQGGRTDSTWTPGIGNHSRSR